MPERKIYGRLTSNKQPLADALVIARDSDTAVPGDKDDFMGQTLTASDGSFTIRYEGGNWDPKIPYSNSYRPDIYLKAKVRSAASGEWVKVWQSKIYSNWKQKDPLEINAEIPRAARASKVIANFDPERFGFDFANSFQVSTSDMGLPGNIGTFGMGFCGGMSAGALHRFETGTPAPNDTQTPTSGTPLFRELFDRQKKSLTPGVLAKILEWQASPDEPHSHTPHSMGYRTRREWPVLKAMIDDSQPAILVLIREEGLTANPTNNHQVLAFGYDHDPSTGDLWVTIYDPNLYGATSKISMCLGAENIRGSDPSSGKRMRGFFVNPNTADAAK